MPIIGLLRFMIECKAHIITHLLLVTYTAIYPIGELCLFLFIINYTFNNILCAVHKTHATMLFKILISQHDTRHWKCLISFHWVP